MTAENGWKWTFDKQPMFKDGKKIVYTVSEDKVEGYTTSVDGLNVTNTHKPAVVTVSGQKTWDDANDQDGIRPEKITINLLADGVEVGERVVTGPAYAWSFPDMPKFANGKEIKYTITEDKVEGYETTVKDYNVTNKHVPATIEINGTKTWDDANNQDGKRPAKITVNLLADGTPVAKATVGAENGWKYVFKDQPKFNNGKEIKYTVSEDKVEGYTASVKDFDITNKHDVEKTSVNVTKAWDDQKDADKMRPGSVKIVLVVDGQDTNQTLVLNDKNKWTGSFGDLAKYKDGKAIAYSVKEVDVPKGYTAKVTSDDKGFLVTNTHKVVPGCDKDKDCKPAPTPEKPKNVPTTGVGGSTGLGALGLALIAGPGLILGLRRKNEK